MNDLPRQKLQHIITQYGNIICSDPKRCEAMLKDFCPDYKREITILIGALRENVAKDLLEQSATLPIEALTPKLAKRLYDHLGIAEEFALWAVESWALALGLVASSLPIPKKPASASIIRALHVTPPQTQHIQSARKTPGQNFTVDLGKGVTLEMIAIPGGMFLMGASKREEGSRDTERPQHSVTIQSFYMGKYPVTQAQWQAIMGNNPSHFKGANRPVESVSWDDAQEFLKTLNTKCRQPLPGRENQDNSQSNRCIFRLPSEAEWEYACRAGTTTPFYFGEIINTDQTNYNGNYVYGNDTKGVYRQQTTDVGIFPPNAWGLYDMHGNVWEWCADTWHKNYAYAPSDGSIWGILDDKNEKVLRGGAWNYYPGNLRSAHRIKGYPDFSNVSRGFRVVC